MKKLLFILLFYCCQFAKGDNDSLKKGKIDLDFMVATDPYSTPTTLLYEGGTLKFRCTVVKVSFRGTTQPMEKIIENFDASTIFFRGSASPEKVPEHLTLNINSTKFGWYTCGSLSKVDGDSGFDLEYLLCDDTSDTCQNLICENPDSRSYCVIRPGNQSPSNCSILNEQSYCHGFGMTSYGYACQFRYGRSPLCHGLRVVDNAVFVTRAGICDVDRVNLVAKTASEERMYLGEVAQFGSSLFVTCNGQPCDSNYINGEEHHITKSQKLTYDPESKSFILPNESYSAVTKIIVKREYMKDIIQTYVYNVRLDASVNLKQDGDIISCSFKYPPEPEQKKMFKLHLMLKLNENVIIESNAERVTADITIGTYLCESEMIVKKCNPFYTTSDNKIETLEVTTSTAGIRAQDYAYHFIGFFIIAVFTFF